MSSALLIPGRPLAHCVKEKRAFCQIFKKSKVFPRLLMFGECHLQIGISVSRSVSVGWKLWGIWIGSAVQIFGLLIYGFAAGNWIFLSINVTLKKCLSMPQLAFCAANWWFIGLHFDFYCYYMRSQSLYHSDRSMKALLVSGCWQ